MNNQTIEMIATTTFGLEATVKRELQNLGFTITSSSDGRIDFSGTFADIPKANIWLRSADRVQVKIGSFEAKTFDELFDQTKDLPWGDWIPKDGKFTVIGKSVKSTLFSVSDCQSIVKKAVVEKLKEKYHIQHFDETGAEYKIQVGMLRDIATLTIDTTGVGLNKRGYRATSVIAPIKETLAAALIELSYWKRDRILMDPFCGSATVGIEAALMAKNIAPGLTRKFVSEQWEQVPPSLWKNARTEAYGKILVDFTPEIYCSDIDSEAVEVAKHNALAAGVEDCLHIRQADFHTTRLPGDYGVMITNPPYGERIGNMEDIRECYVTMRRLFNENPTWSLYLITSDEDFEKVYGKKANAKRKLFNGMLKTDYYQYYGPRPPRNPVDKGCETL